MLENSKILKGLTEIEGLAEYLSNSTEALHIVSGDTIILWANKSELNFLGYSAHEYIGHPITKFHVDQEIITDILEKLLSDEIINNYPARLKAKDGSIKQVLINSSGYWKDGKFSHTRCFSRDVTGIVDLSEKIDERISEIISSKT